MSKQISISMNEWIFEQLKNYKNRSEKIEEWILRGLMEDAAKKSKPLKMDGNLGNGKDAPVVYPDQRFPILDIFDFYTPRPTEC